jgi:hypothetical protein
VALSYPPNHRYTIRNSSVLWDVRFSHADSDSAWHLVEGCVIGEDVVFTHGGGPVVNTVRNCTIAGGVSNRTGGGAGPPYGTLIITGNTLHGISDVGLGAYTTIAWNTLPTGIIDDGSEGTGTGEDQIIEHNTLMDGIISLRSASVTVRYNAITCSRDTTGIRASSGTPTNIVGNTINLPYSVPTGEYWEWEAIGMRLYCGEGVVSGNTVNGSGVGIVNRSLVAEISNNTVNGAHIGLYTRTNHGADAYVGNVVSGCVGDGVVVAAAAGRFSDNSITDNGGAGVRLRATADLGGGAAGSTGGNTITGNAGYDVFVEVPTDSAAVIYAEGNAWDHGSEGEVDALDVWDANDDPTLSELDFMPLGLPAAGWSRWFDEKVVRGRGAQLAFAAGARSGAGCGRVCDQ